MTVADLLKLLAGLGEVLKTSGAASVATELQEVALRLQPFGEYKLKAFAAFLEKAEASARGGPTPPKATARKPAGADPQRLQTALDALRGLYHRALEPDVTVERIQAEVGRLADMTKSQLDDLARQFEITRKLQKKDDVLKAIAQRIIDRKGAFERAQA